jgi:hypothetical protein
MPPTRKTPECADAPATERRRLKRPVRRAATKWTIYQHEHKGDVTHLATQPERARELARRYRSLDPDAVAELEVRAAEDRTRHAHEVAAMTDGDRLVAKVIRRRTRARRRRRYGSTPRPKRPRTAYLYFSQEVVAGMRAERPSTSPTEILREAGRRWHALSAEEREPYNESHREDVERHRLEIEVWQAKMREEEESARKTQ